MEANLLHFKEDIEVDFVFWSKGFVYNIWE